MKLPLLLSVVLIVLLVLAAGKFAGTRNDLLQEQEAIAAQWDQVDDVLDKRAALVPNLVDTVKRVAQHETDVFQNVANARAAVVRARTPRDRIQANQQLDGALARLLVITENYPQLRSSQKFQLLEDEIAETENRIAVERRKYNEALQRYNTSIELFPNNIVASLSRFARNDAYFKTEPGDASYLRRKIDSPFGRRALQTVRGAGYKLAPDGG